MNYAEKAPDVHSLELVRSSIRNALFDEMEKYLRGGVTAKQLNARTRSLNANTRSLRKLVADSKGTT